MAQRTQVSFATCNLLNINLPGLEIYSDRDGWSQEAYEKKVTWTSRLISHSVADVWGFQELWHYEVLKAVFDAAELSEDYQLLAPQEHDGDRIICAGAVRQDILEGEPEWIKVFPEKFILKSSGSDRQTSEILVSINSFSRPVLHFKVCPRSSGKIISVYVAHLKSKSPTRLYREGWYREDDEYYKKDR